MAFPGLIGKIAAKIAKSVPNPQMSRRLFMQRTGTAAAVGAAKGAVKKVVDASPVGKVQRLTKLAGDAGAAKDMYNLSRGDTTMMSRRQFLQGAGKKAAGLAAKKRKEIASGVGNAVKAVTDPTGYAIDKYAAQNNPGKVVKAAKKIIDQAGFSRNRFGRRAFFTQFLPALRKRL